jgi:hypothetical protein
LAPSGQVQSECWAWSVSIGRSRTRSIGCVM